MIISFFRVEFLFPIVTNAYNDVKEFLKHRSTNTTQIP